MNQLNIKDVFEYVENNIETFHLKRIQCLDKLKLSYVLKRKNPYLFKAKYIMTADEIVHGIVDAYVSSNEETIFGNWLEGLAIFINEKVFGGIKSGIPGIDIEFNNNNIRYIVAVKSGPNWGNSSQLKKIITDFNTARKTLRTSNSNLNIVAVIGCCYGIDRKPEKKENYFKFCGQKFWTFISGDDKLYIDILKPLGHKSKEKNEVYIESYSKLINKLTKELIKDFCRKDGSIDWDKLVIFNSSN